MPNHVINELIFRNVDAVKQEEILAKVRGSEGVIDFETLLPSPLNIWKGSVSSRHKDRFPGTQLDWNRDNWGTKWNAYGLSEDGKYKSIVQADDTLTLTFQTAWAPPMGWIVALFNFFKLSFDHNWLDEGEERGHSDKFIADEMDKMIGEPWQEKAADDEIQKHLHLLLWGVESFDDEDEAKPEAQA